MKNPPDPTLAEIAKNSTERIANTLDTTLTLVKDDISAIRLQVTENGKKLDALGKGRR